MLSLGLRSLLSRRLGVALTVLSIALSVALILSIERMRSVARDSFTDTVSGIDLIVAARGNGIQILLATVFGMGSTSNAMAWETYRRLAALPAVDWTVPLAFGDNHRGFPVVGTTPAYFERFRHGADRPLVFAAGGAFGDAQQAVLGAEVAQRLGYGIGTRIVNAHGAGEAAFDVHDEAPFTVTGLLERTGTPVDRMVFVSLEGFAAIHEEHSDGARAGDRLATLLARDSVPRTRPRAHEDHGHGAHEDEHAAEHDAHHDAAHGGRINAVYMGLESRTAILGLQRYVAEYREEPLSAVMPAVTLLELWSLTGVAENSLRVMAVAVLAVGLLGMVAMITTALEARRREFAILRSVGASPRQVFALILLEAGLTTGAAVLLGTLLLYAVLVLAGPLLASRYGLQVGLHGPSSREWGLVLLIGVGGLVASLYPAYRVYRMTLADGLAIKV